MNVARVSDTKTLLPKSEILKTADELIQRAQELDYAKVFTIDKFDPATCEVMNKDPLLSCFKYPRCSNYKQATSDFRPFGIFDSVENLAKVYETFTSDICFILTQAVSSN